MNVKNASVLCSDAQTIQGSRAAQPPSLPSLIRAQTRSSLCREGNRQVPHIEKKKKIKKKERFTQSTAVTQNFTLRSQNRFVFGHETWREMLQCGLEGLVHTKRGSGAFSSGTHAVVMI